MNPQGKYLLALVALMTSLCSASGFHAHALHDAMYPRQVPNVASVSTTQLYQLKQYVDTYKGWMNFWINSQPVGASITQLKQLFVQYEGWVETWLSQAIGICKQTQPSLGQCENAYNSW